MSKFLVLLIFLLNFGEESLSTILRGTRAKSGQFPWLIQFQTVVPCGGVLVSPDWVLTAAQCVQYKRNSITLYGAGLNGSGSSQTVGVKATYIFPKYRSYASIPDHEHNVALIKLIEPFDMCDDRVKLIEISPVELNDDYKTCLIFGWQSYVSPSTKVLAKPIQYSKVILNTWKLCTYMLKGNMSYNNVFCTMIESDNGIKACAGNPGSPVVCENQHQRMILLGVASWSNFSLDCDGIPTYLGVSVFRSWMYDLIFSDNQNNHLNDLRKNKTLEDYRLNNYGVIPVDILIERDDNLRQYHEVGPRREVSIAEEDETIKAVDEESKIDDELNELEFAIPLDEDYFIAGSYSIRFCGKLGLIIVAYGCIVIN